MRRITLTMPLALAALAFWLALTVGGRWLEADAQQTLADAAAGGIGLSWALAALFSLAVLAASRRRRAAGLCAPHPARSLWLAWPPLVYALLMLLLAWAGGWPTPGMLLIAACNAALVAVSEELMFRGVLLQGMLQRHALWPAVLGSSLIFGLVHTANGLATGEPDAALWQAAAAAMQGVGYAAIRLRTRSAWTMVPVHALWDFALVSAMLGDLERAVQADDGVSVLPFAALLAVLPLCLYGVYLLRPSQRAALLADQEVLPATGCGR